MDVRIVLSSDGMRRNPPSAQFALFALGFRPFYLLAAVFAALSVPLWIAQYFGLFPRLGPLDPIVWHAHEMTFGFAAAVISGFLFTAVRNWTGQPTPAGGTLAALAFLWLAGRALMLTGPTPAAAIVDVAFLPLVAWSIFRPLKRTRNRNQFLVALLLILAAANVLFHLARTDRIALPSLALAEAAIGLVALIVAIMAGRVIPAFTRNACPQARIRQIKGLDPVAIGMLALALIAWIGGLSEVVVVPLCVGAAVLNLARLWQWDPIATRAQPILWILHLSYAWIPLGMLLLAFALAHVAGTPASALHALGIGAIGGMIMGMMTRTARGHTGRALIASKAEVIAYVLVHLAGLARVVVPLIRPQLYVWALVTAALFWSTAFAVYAIQYWPILSRARIDGKPG